MSLEAALEKNTAALDRVAELLAASNAGREAAVEKIIADGAKPARAKKADKEDTAPAGRPAGSTNAKTETAAPKAPTADELRAAAMTFMGPKEGRPPEKSTFITAINAHLGITKITEAEPTDYAQIIAWLEAKGRGEDVRFSEGEDDQPAAEDDDDDI